MGARVDCEIAASHEYQLFYTRCQAGQGCHSVWPLQRQQRVVGHGDHFAAIANACPDVGNIAHLARAVDDDKNFVIPFVEKHQVIHDGAFVRQQQPIALFAHGQIDHVHRHQRLERGGGIGADQSQLPHVRHIKQAGGRAGVLVFGHQARRILHRHGVARKGHHACAQFNVQRVEWRCQ